MVFGMRGPCLVCFLFGGAGVGVRWLVPAEQVLLVSPLGAAWAHCLYAKEICQFVSSAEGAK